MLKEVKAQRDAELVIIEFTRMGPNYWVPTVTGKQMLPRAVGEQMVREGAFVQKIYK